MPELPEVETVLQAIKPHLLGKRFTAITTHIRKLRTPLVLAGHPELLHSTIAHLERRAKYIVLQLANGSGLLIHLGMTGTWRLEPANSHRQKHDHVEFFLSSGLVLRYHDPRRFGQIVVLGQQENPLLHPLLRHLGPEPLHHDFNRKWLADRCRGRKKPIKTLLMDNFTVVGVGNIYASKSLFRAGINPLLAAGKITGKRTARLVRAIKDVLQEAIDAGGTTVKDYASLDGKEGYFNRQLMVYGKTGQKCRQCKRGIIRQTYQSGRSTFYCPVCQR